MTKQICLFLVILTHVTAHGMENNLSINDFEKQLKSKPFPCVRLGLPNDHIRFKDSTKEIEADPFSPIEFLQYCYYQKSYVNKWTLDRLNPVYRIENSEKVLSEDEVAATKKLLLLCQNAQIGGYSAISAALLAEAAPIEATIGVPTDKFIQNLLELGFEFTTKDLIFAIESADKYKTILRLLDIMLHLLDMTSQSKWSELSEDIRKYITGYVIQIFKTNPCYLPDKDIMTTKWNISDNYSRIKKIRTS